MSAQESRRFYVHDCAHDRQGGHVVRDSDFHGAAIAFAEDWGAAAEGDLKVVVRDCESGEEQCFVVHVAAHDAQPC